jgi:hypothetical protein
VRLLNRKSRLQRLLDTVTDSLHAPDGLKLGLPDLGSSNPLKADPPQDKVLKAGLIAGGLAGLTAASAGVSSLRRRLEGTSDAS